MEAWWAGPMAVADEVVVKPHKRHLLGKYISTGAPVKGKIVCANRDAMVVTYEIDGLLVEKCIVRWNSDLDRSERNSEELVLRVLPDAPYSAYPEEFITEDAETLRFGLGKFLWDLGKGFASHFMLVCFLIVFLFSVHAGRDFTLKALVYGLMGIPFGALKTFASEVSLNLFIFPFVLKLSAVKYDRDYFLTRMEGRIEKNKKYCGVLE
eukprot:CAMPEP_0197446934 /NCGR_PEP_ID=MMETSP1175-20131217/11734_1 /TAXON_ID=1003142 /ORGANISM="Triceratium dubium, Strain CCMP147" /LENGTH=208 /DNA_ID=CAMNT_0042978111 /DNA_START=259 /DNA_END=885 /DNA_ORIENTATION=-